MKDLQNIKEQVAIELGYKSNSVFSAHEQLVINPNGSTYKVLSNSIDQVAIRYAQEQKRELVGMLITLRDECDGNNFSFFRDKIEELINSATEG